MNKRLGCLTGSGIISVILTLLVLTGLVLAQGFQLFSPGDLSEKSGPPLGGVTSHAGTGGNCSACHSAPWEAAGMDDRCLQCHVDISQQIFAVETLHGVLMQNNSNLSCRACHPEHNGPNAPTTNLSKVDFPHDQVGFSLRAHKTGLFEKSIECFDCHGEDLLKVDIIQCGTCHLVEDPEFLQPHLTAFGTDCLACHDGIDTYGKNFNHNLVPFKLEGGHASVECGICHVNQQNLEGLKNTTSTCFTCHEKDDPHFGRFGENCILCHSVIGWDQVTFDHNLLQFKLEGKHAGLPCEQCHKSEFISEIESDCYSCHARDDVHNGRFGLDCEVCHSVFDWKPTAFDHNLANFHLEGKHAGLSCEQCHANSQYKGTASSCYACHSAVDVHKGNLGLVCSNCHSATGWLPAIFDHSLSIFPLSGKHAGAVCQKCHVNQIYKGTPTLCYSCHLSDDKHQGLFGSNCGTCHSTLGWIPATFDHSMSIFRLTGKHVNVACQSCHSNGVYKGTPTSCYSCHLGIDKHNGRYGTSCGSCHFTTGWLPASFDHSRSSFPLTGAHQGVNCTSCHNNNVYQGTPTACSSCHSQPGSHGGLSSNCLQCHTTVNWNFNHPSVSKIDPLRHKGATCGDCHPSGYSSYSCTKCHDNNNPDD